MVHEVQDHIDGGLEHLCIGVPIFLEGILS